VLFIRTATGPRRPYDAFHMSTTSGRRATHWTEERSRHGGVDQIPLPPEVRGRLFVCGKQFIGPDPEAALAHVGATAVVCLNEESELARYPNYVTWLRNQPPERLVWSPIPDLGAPAPEAALELLAELRFRLTEGERLLLHCGAGVGRAGTVAAGILVTLGSAPEDAIDHVRAHRPLAGPEAGAQTELLLWLGGPADEVLSGRDADRDLAH
jgi:protein-tyrosine phosphatase